MVPADMPNDAAAFVEPVSTVNAILDRVSPKASDRCVVVGDDSLAIITAQVMAGRCRTVMLGRSQQNVAAAVALGIDARMLAKSDERDFDIAVETTGVGEIMLTALELLRPTGILVLKNTIPGFTPVPLWKIAVREITVIGSRCGPFPPAIESLARGTVKVAPLITARFALDDFAKAIEEANKPGSLKVLLYPGGLP
jgi:threonine dehydrogenase-like Zn-dependent dehydrogenase